MSLHLFLAHILRNVRDKEVKFLTRSDPVSTGKLGKVTLDFIFQEGWMLNADSAEVELTQNSSVGVVMRMTMTMANGGR
jgi:hypothetical protein